MKKFLCPLRLKDNPFIKNTYSNYFKKFNVVILYIGYINITFIKDNLEMFDGLLLPGGGDINPNRYKNEKVDFKYNNKQDKLDFDLLELFIKSKKKVIGICRGIQIINVYFKGTLFFNIDGHFNKKHCVYYKNNHVYCNSYHHQAIDSIGKYLTITYVSNDGIIEGIKKDNQILGYQFHIELMNNQIINNEIKYFLEN